MKGRKSTAYLIKEQRAKLRMSQQDLATKLGVNRSTISRYESGYIDKMPIEILIPLSEALQTTPEYLMGWDEAELSFEEKLIQAYKRADSKTKLAIRTLLDIEE